MRRILSALLLISVLGIAVPSLARSHKQNHKNKNAHAHRQNKAHAAKRHKR